MIDLANVNAELANWRMGQEVAPEERVVLGLYGASLAETLHSFGSSPAGSVQAHPSAAGFQPMLDRAALRGIGIRTRNISDQQPADGQPLLDVREVVADRCLNFLLGQ